uniref:Uncharacterized protein n=1 Tax=uncultured bacterium contig00026 TaxID=1181515 RepID=A0A806JXZ1_9BACT|nr:hypothetical protein [uncultured bacterium contig00026]
MKKTVLPQVFIFLLLLTPALYAQEEDGTALTTGKNAALGVEASTTFVYDAENNSTGLETRVGLELIFPLFPASDKGVKPEDTNAPAVRFIIKDAAFTWWNTYQTSGGNYEQDDFNSWQARPLILTFDTFMADLVWKNYFFRVASSTTMMRVDTVSLRSIFDDVMDAGDRFYYSRNQALWRTDRYNIQNLPILGNRITRDALDVDYRNNISGILAGGVEFERFGGTLKAASYLKGIDNNDNAWLIGADFEIVPFDNFKIDITSLFGFNYEKTPLGKNPVSFGIAAEYRLPFTDNLILTPFAGFDFFYDTVSEESEWELGAGVMLYTRGFDERVSYRVLDYDNVIPVGASLGMNINHDSQMNIMLSWFDPPGRDSLIENFGGFLQLELANLLGSEEDMDFAILTQLEYAIMEKFTPYLRGGYKNEITGGRKTGNMILKFGAGLYLTPVHFFSLDLRYEMNPVISTSGTEPDKGLLSLMFTIRI